MKSNQLLINFQIGLLMAEYMWLNSRWFKWKLQELLNLKRFSRKLIRKQPVDLATGRMSCRCSVRENNYRLLRDNVISSMRIQAIKWQILNLQQFFDIRLGWKPNSKYLISFQNVWSASFWSLRENTRKEVYQLICIGPCLPQTMFKQTYYNLNVTGACYVHE